ncbi:MAG: aminotransferase class III-fold pyridoxal phosphate-dependent enzyme, partial [Isosphaeraceae bacterium]
DGLLERGLAIGERFRSQFEALRRELPERIREVRVRGVMVGLDLTFDASDVVSECLKRRLLINATHGHVVRLLPALTISDELIDQGCAILADVLREVVV